MACCCNKAQDCCATAAEPVAAALRCVENLPLVGHLLASFYACCGSKDRAERAAIKATVGFIMAPFNLGAEVFDEIVRRRAKKLRSFSLKPRPTWMRSFHRRPLMSLCLPASHQSGTYHMHSKLKPVPMVEGWSRCQALDIREQLQGGVRFLDVRLMDRDGQVWLHHNLVTCIRFKDLLVAVHDFVRKNPSEVVGMHLTNDGKSLDWSNVHRDIVEHISSMLIHQDMKDMDLGDIVQQSKHVFVCGVPGAAYNWTILDWIWPNKAWPKELRADLEERLDAHYPAGRLTWYKAECTPNAAMVTRNIGGLPGLIAAKCANEKFEFIRGMAAAVNHEVFQVLQSLNHLPFQILSMDYAQDDIIDKIIEINEAMSKSLEMDLMVGDAGELMEIEPGNSFLMTSSMGDLTVAPKPILEAWESNV